MCGMRLAYIILQFGKLQMVDHGWDSGFMCGASRTTKQPGLILKVMVHHRMFHP